MAAVNRKTLRDELTSVLSAALVPTTIKVAYGYLPTSFGKNSPALCVVSAGSDRSRVHLGASSHHTWVLFNLFSFVLYAEQTGGTWTRALAEDRQDLIEAGITDVVIANKTRPGFWDELSFAGPSKIEQVVIGEMFLQETFLLKARVIYG